MKDELRPSEPGKLLSASPPSPSPRYYVMSQAETARLRLLAKLLWATVLVLIVRDVHLSENR